MLSITDLQTGYEIIFTKGIVMAGEDTNKRAVRDFPSMFCSWIDEWVIISWAERSNFIQSLLYVRYELYFTVQLKPTILICYFYQ